MGRNVARALYALLFATAVVLLPRGEASARPCRPGLIPNGFKNGCANCHLNPKGGGPRNAFGKTVEAVVVVATCNPFWSPEIAVMDSDGDGIPNGVELQDPDGTWTPGSPPPGDPAKVTNAGLPNVEFVRADSNGDGTITVADAIFTLKSIFQGGGPIPCEAASDANGDARINIVD